MIAAIMQPYFLPYIGYFQLMKAVDIFVIYDDVQFITRGWVNRNLIQVGSSAAWLTMPVLKAPRATPINRRMYVEDAAIRAAARLRDHYRQAPHYTNAAPVLNQLLEFPSTNVADFNANLLKGLARELGIQCQIITSSEFGIDDNLRGARRIMEICRRLRARKYINPIGGVDLYDAQEFSRSDIELAFLYTTSIPIQLGGDAKHLSIAHMLLHDGFDATAKRLDEYALQVSVA